MGGPKARDRRKLLQVVPGFLGWIAGLLGNGVLCCFVLRPLSLSPSFCISSAL